MFRRVPVAPTVPISCPFAAWIPATLLIVLGAISWTRHGSATTMTASAFVPSTSLKDVIFRSAPSQFDAGKK